MFIKHWRSFTGKLLIQLKVVGYIMPDFYYYIILYLLWSLGVLQEKDNMNHHNRILKLSVSVVIYDVSVQTWEDGAESKINNTPSFFLKHRARIQVFRYSGIQVSHVSNMQQQCRDDRHEHSKMIILFAVLLFVCPVARSSTISYWQHNSTCNKNIKSCINCSNISN